MLSIFGWVHKLSQQMVEKNPLQFIAKYVYTAPYFVVVIHIALIPLTAYQDKTPQIIRAPQHKHQFNFYVA